MLSRRRTPIFKAEHRRPLPISSHSTLQQNVKYPTNTVLWSAVFDTEKKTMQGQRSLSVPKGRDVPLAGLINLAFIVTALFFVFLLGSVVAEENQSAQLPQFLEPIPNKTVVVGRDVILPCSVDNLKGYKVAWIFVETQTILTIHHTIITKNPRFSLARHDHKHWYLQISDVKPSDRGLYMCQVNSDPMMSQVGFLDVQVPPDIIDTESSSEVVAQEGNDVSLRCKAKGSPRPLISWKREDGSRIHPAKGINLKVTDSEVLHIPKVSRLHMGAYLCIASNKVPPSVSKRIILKVQFAPVLWIPNQLVGVSQGNDVTLECHTEAFPRSINYWTDSNGLMILSTEKYDGIVAENGYKAYMRLKIKGVTASDYGTFGCTAKNSFGESNGTIKVYELPSDLLINPPNPKNKKTNSENDEEMTEDGDRKKGVANGHSGEEKRRLGDKRGRTSIAGGENFNNDSISTMMPDGVINFDVRKLYKENRDRKRGRSSAGSGGFLPIDLHLPPSRAPKSDVNNNFWTMISFSVAVSRTLVAMVNCVAVFV